MCVYAMDETILLFFSFCSLFPLVTCMIVEFTITHDCAWLGTLFVVMIVIVIVRDQTFSSWSWSWSWPKIFFLFQNLLFSNKQIEKNHLQFLFYNFNTLFRSFKMRMIRR
jgi:hypothetical protein